MKYYELTYLISPELSDEKLKNLSSKISGFIKEEEGILRETTEPVKRKLGYLIKKKGFTSSSRRVREVFLITSNFNLNSGKLENLEKKLKAEDEILRHLILIKKESEKTPKKISIPQKLIKPLPLSKKEEKSKAPPKVELKEIDKKIEEILKE